MSKNHPIRVAVIGATGYTGVELLRILLGHPQVQVTVITSRQNEGKKFSDLFPAFEGRTDLTFSAYTASEIARQAQTAFLCLPHHESMEVAAELRALGLKVIDLSADFRLQDKKVYEQWYGPHTQEKLLAEAVYAQPETVDHDQIAKASLIACPGCYPTSVILGLAPLLSAKLIKTDDIICDSKSGVSGAGRTAKIESLFAEVSENFKAYNIAKHRHSPEIEQGLSTLAGSKVTVLFSPHLVPMDRGILSTIYCKPLKTLEGEKLHQIYTKFYEGKPFVKVLPLGQLPATKNVRGTNDCHLGLIADSHSGRIVIVSAIDNLTKGASGQAVQALNIMNGWDETLGLTGIGLIP